MNLSFLIYLKNMGKFIIYRVAQKSLDPRYLQECLASGYVCPILYVCVCVCMYVSQTQYKKEEENVIGLMR